jgi:hypothetical protein
LEPHLNVLLIDILEPIYVILIIDNLAHDPTHILPNVDTVDPIRINDLNDNDEPNAD